MDYFCSEVISHGSTVIKGIIISKLSDSDGRRG